MALETLGVLVNIAGDSGGLVNAVQKARTAFASLTTKTEEVTQKSMPAFQRLQHQIDAVTARTNIATRMQAEWKMKMDVAGMAVKNTSEKMAKLTSDFSRFEYGGVKPSEAAVKKYDTEMEKLTGILAKQDEQLRKSTKGYQDYTDKIAAATARTAKLKGEQEQVRVPDQKSTAQKLFDALGAGAGLFNIGTSMLGQIGSLFGGKGKPALGGRMARDEMAFDKLAGDLTVLGAAAGPVSIPFIALAKAMAVGELAARAIAGAFNFVVTAVTDMGRSMVGLIEQSTLAAGRNQELAIVSQYMGQQAGHSSAEIDKVTKSLKEHGASIAAANDAVTQFSRANMDLSKATDLLSVSQGAAIISGQDSSAVMQQLIYGIITLQPEMLRTAGIVINADEAYKKYAATLKVNVNALSGEQKQQAFLNETLEKGAKLQGLYAEAMKLPGKQLRSLTDREIPDLLSMLGTPFQSAFKVAVESARGVVLWFTKAVQEGGKLKPIMDALDGAIANVSATVKALVDQGGTAFDNMVGSWTNSIAGFIKNAGVYGSNLIVSFANGIISGAGSVLDALSYIGGLISYWLAPGSPPKLLPELTRWGADAVGEYMKGWTQTDLSVFDQLAGKLEGVLKGMEDSLGKANTIPAIQAMRVNVANAVQEMMALGNVTKSTMDRIAASFGSVGPLVRNYVKAVLDVAKAQKELDDITKKYDDELEKLNTQLSAMQEKKTEQDEDAQIKALQRVMTRVSSTDKQKAAAQAEIDEIQLRKKIRLTENEKDTAVKAAQLKLDLANKNLIIQQALLDNQQKTNDLMLEQARILEQIAKEAAAAAKAASAAKGGGGGIVKPETPIKPVQMTGTYMPGLQGQGMGKPESPIQSIMDKLAELQKKWDAFVSGWNDFWQGPKGEKITGAFQYVWNEFRAGRNVIDAIKIAMKSFMSKEDQEKFDKVDEEINNFVGTTFEKAVKNIGDMAESFSKLFTAISGGSGTETNPILASFLGILGLLFVELPKAITWILNLGNTFVNVQKEMKLWADVLVAFLKAEFANAFLLILEKVNNFKQGATELKDLLIGKFDEAVKAVEKFFRESLNPAFDTLKKIIGDINTFFGETLISAFTTFKDFVLNTLVPLVITPLTGFLQGLWDKAQGVIDSINWIAGHMGQLNPFKKEHAEGGPVMKGMPSLVGERGLEMFVPKSDGFILPNNFLQSMVKMAMPASYINTNSGNRSVQNVRNNYLTVQSSVSSQGLVADWARLQVLGA